MAVFVLKKKMAVRKWSIMERLNDVRFYSISLWLADCRASHRAPDEAMRAELRHRLAAILVDDVAVMEGTTGLLDDFMNESVRYAFGPRDIVFENTEFALLRAAWFDYVSSYHNSHVCDPQEPTPLEE